MVPGISRRRPHAAGHGRPAWWAASALLLLLAPMVAQGQGAAGEVRGRVADREGAAILGATVSVLGDSRQVVSDGSGGFRLPGVASGPVRVLVRRLGFVPDTLRTVVPAGGTVSVEAVLRPVPQQLASVEVRERRQPFDARLSGVRDRMEKRRGYFIAPERLRRANTPMLTDLLREVPGVRLSRSSANLPRSVRIRSFNCPPLVFIDGFPASAGEFDLDMIDPASVEVVEVHSSIASMPAEFGAARGLERCGVIAIWSRPAPPRPARVAGSRAAAAADLEGLVADGRAYTAAQVDEVATVVSGTALPEYPDSLWSRRTAGRVVVEFVVGPDAELVAETVRVVSSTHPAFAASVRRALEQAEFTAAVRRGRAVSQIVQVPFVFSPTPAGRDGDQGRGAGTG